MSILANSNAIESGGYNLTRSLRFRKSATANLTRTFASAGNRKTWTYSAWVKLGSLAGPSMSIFSANASASTISFDDQGGYYTIAVDGVYNGTRHLRYTSSFYRDPSAWYHVVVALDTTQATDTNRIKLYVNGSQISLANAAVGSWPAQNSDGNIDNNIQHCIGQRIFTTDYNLDGYLTEVNFIDGQALTPSSFGSTNAETGVWQPSKYTGTYGTNGFYLPFTDTSSTTNLVKDSSGNANNWTPNNISLTAGTTYDSMTDVPTLTSATAANYCTLNPAISSTTNLINANLTRNGAVRTNVGTIPLTNGKYYFETTIQDSNGNGGVGVKQTTAYPLENSDTSKGATYFANGEYKIEGGAQTSGFSTYTNGDVIGIAVDTTQSPAKIWFAKNNTWQGTGNPTTSGYSLTAGLDYLFAILHTSGSSSTTASANFGQQGFTYTPPTGYVALNTYNLPTPTILKGNTVMDATIWTGDGATSKTITNAAGFKPDFVWLKERDISIDNILYDSIRGPSTSSASKALSSNQTIAEGSENDNSTYGYLDSFTSSGFTVVRGSNGTTSYTNKNTGTYVGWQWQAGQGTNTTNTSGSITSTVSVNATAGFSVVTYTGNGVNSASVGHGLGIKPAMVIIKSRSLTGEGWVVWHKSLPLESDWLRLNETGAYLSSQTRVSAFSSTTFTLGATANTETNGNGSTYVAYCWAEIAGFSKFGSYIGNGSADGPFIYTGFLSKFILIKASSSAGYNWYLWDTARNTYNVLGEELSPNLSDAAATQTDLDVTSNGFKLRTSASRVNGSGITYIYACFASNPFKNSNAF